MYHDKQKLNIKSFRESYEKRKKQRQDIISCAQDKIIEIDPIFENCLIRILSDKNLILPTNTKQLDLEMNKQLSSSPTPTVQMLHNLIQKLALRKIIDVRGVTISGWDETGYEIFEIFHEKLEAAYSDCLSECKSENLNDYISSEVKKEEPEDPVAEYSNKMRPLNDASEIMSLLSLPSTKEKQNKQVGEEILELLSKPTAKERSLVEKFKSQGGTQVMEFCPHGTRVECLKAQQISFDDMEDKPDAKTSEDSNFEDPSSSTIVESFDKTKSRCKRLHFKKIIQGHTDESLGDCSFLNTCFHMSTCKYVHYEVDSHSITDQTLINKNVIESEKTVVSKRNIEVTLFPPQWIQCDLRYLDMTILGKFAVIMADPPWDIHMELPYGTMSDDEMRQLGVPALQDDGLIFLWVTGRAMELGRECLKLWGYERVDELIWVKTNQLQRIIRTGRTGHWLNHGKEHCLVGLKGNPQNLNRGLDCDVIVAEVRATSHKPDEIYGIIERLSPGTKKIELFGRPHNVQPNWITLGNQLDGIRLVDPELISSFQKRYPDGNCMNCEKDVTRFA